MDSEVRPHYRSPSIKVLHPMEPYSPMVAEAPTFDCVPRKRRRPREKAFCDDAQKAWV